MQENRQNNIMPIITGLASALLFGAATPASKALLAGIDEQILAGLLYIGAAIGVLPFVARQNPQRSILRTSRRTLLLLSGAILLGGVVGPLLLLMGLKVASSGSVSLWLSLEFVATVVLGHFVFREHMTPRAWVAAAGTLLAATLLAGGNEEFGILSVSLVGCACLCWGFDNHFTALIDGMTPSQITMWKGFVAGTFNFAVGIALGGTIGSLKMVVGALFVGAASYGVSVTLYIISAQGLGATRSQMIFSCAPFFGMLLSVTFLGEKFTAIQMLSTIIIAASLVLVFHEKHGHSHRHESVYHYHRHQHNDRHHDHEHSDIHTKEGHLHWHAHEPVLHKHEHWPDLHHRHGHVVNQKKNYPKKPVK